MVKFWLFAKYILVTQILGMEFKIPELMYMELRLACNSILQGGRNIPTHHHQSRLMFILNPFLHIPLKKKAVLLTIPNLNSSQS